jgi:hypothetical protein
LKYFVTIWYILWLILYILSRFGMLYQEKSDNGPEWASVLRPNLFDLDEDLVGVVSGAAAGSGQAVAQPFPEVLPPRHSAGAAHGGVGHAEVLLRM